MSKQRVPTMAEMNLLDLFAGQVLAGLCANPAYMRFIEGKTEPAFDAELAAEAYATARAMLAQRAKESK